MPDARRQSGSSLGSGVGAQASRQPDGHDPLGNVEPKGHRTGARADAFRRESFALPREEARAMARELFRRFPKAAYQTEIETWRVLPGDCIEFTVRRLPSAD